MTHRRNRQQDRAVRAYKRAHPGITLDQARQAVAARTGLQQDLPPRIPAAPLPRPTETLADYIKRVAAAAGVQRHQAMELLGLKPGTSATQRLDELTRGRLPDHTVRALTAATGMTPDQAHTLAAPRTAHPDEEAVRRTVEGNAIVNAKSFRRGGEGKTSTDTRDLARLLAETSGPQPLPFDLPSNELRPAPYRPVIVDLNWPTDTATPPIDPDVFDEVAKALGIEQNTNTDTPPHK
ncbi:hypothetical protein ABR737_00205 [Streptomyces sp. Edi2]|uniref:hypothetical protein n=1 Tax=Streptomyces sp. Edi2 TaxID=3162528 RepID=UPI0033057E1A